MNERTQTTCSLISCFFAAMLLILNLWNLKMSYERLEDAKERKANAESYLKAANGQR